MSENKSRGAQGSRHNKGKIKGPKAKKEVKPVIVDKNASEVRTLVREARQELL